MVAPAPAPSPTPAPTPAPGMWASFLSLLGEPKFLVFLASVIAWIALKLGFNLDQSTIDRYLALAGSFLVAQGIHDHGKAVGAAKLRAAGGFVRLAVMPIIAAVALVIGGVFAVMTGCHTGQVVLAAGQCILDSSVLSDVLAALAASNYAELVANLETKDGAAIVACALQAIAAGNAAPPADAGSGSATPAAAPAVDIRVARARELLAKKAR